MRLFTFPKSNDVIVLLSYFNRSHKPGLDFQLKLFFCAQIFLLFWWWCRFFFFVARTFLFWSNSNIVFFFVVTSSIFFHNLNYFLMIVICIALSIWRKNVIQLQLLLSNFDTDPFGPNNISLLTTYGMHGVLIQFESIQLKKYLSFWIAYFIWIPIFVGNEIFKRHQFTFLTMYDCNI